MAAFFFDTSLAHAARKYLRNPSETSPQQAKKSKNGSTSLCFASRWAVCSRLRLFLISMHYPCEFSIISLERVLNLPHCAFKFFAAQIVLPKAYHSPSAT